MAGYVSPRLRIRFEPGEGADNLSIFAPDGARLLRFDELARLRLREQRAEEQARIADAERARAERLAARLRDLGVEPE